MKKVIINLCLIIILAVCFSSAIFASPSDNSLAVDSLISSDTASYRIMIKNDDIVSHKYILPSKKLSEEFKATFFLNNKVINEVAINAGDTVITNLQASSVKKTTGTKVLNVEVKRDDGKIYTLPLSITANSEYSLTITNQINGLNVINGQNLDFDIAVSNTGSKDINNVGLKFELPYKWLQSINPEKASLKSGEQALFKVKVAVPPTQTSGNNKIKIMAVSDNTSSRENEISVTVQNNPRFIYWAIGLIIIIGLSTLAYFKKHGRR